MRNRPFYYFRDGERWSISPDSMTPYYEEFANWLDLNSISGPDVVGDTIHFLRRKCVESGGSTNIIQSAVGSCLGEVTSFVWLPKTVNQWLEEYSTQLNEGYPAKFVAECFLQNTLQPVTDERIRGVIAALTEAGRVSGTVTDRKLKPFIPRVSSTLPPRNVEGPMYRLWS